MGGLHYASEAIFHAGRLLSYSDKIARPLYRIHDILFVLARLGSISLAVLTFSHGLAKLPEVDQVVNWQSGTFNTPLFRIFALVAICALQAWLMLNFITFQLKKRREDAALQASMPSGKTKKSQQEKAKAGKEKPKKE